jgi:prepilin-type processing-associated H-X9-DG protein
MCNETVYRRPGRQEDRMRQGIALVEFLIVIAIVAILSGILFPVMGQVKAKAWVSSCTSNLRQLGASYLQYADDNNGRFVPNEFVCGRSLEWYCYTKMQRVQPYIKNLKIQQCPANPSPQEHGFTMPKNGIYVSYGYNGILSGQRTASGGGPRKPPIALSEIVRSGHVVLLHDSPALGALNGINSPDRYYVSVPDNSSVSSRHGGGTVFVLADGHCVRYSGCDAASLALVVTTIGKYKISWWYDYDCTDYFRH